MSRSLQYFELLVFVEDRKPEKLKNSWEKFLLTVWIQFDVKFFRHFTADHFGITRGTGFYRGKKMGETEENWNQIWFLNVMKSINEMVLHAIIWK